MAQGMAVSRSDVRDAADLERIRDALVRRLAELREDREQAVATVAEVKHDSRDVPLGDEVDMVAKAADLDREASIIAGLGERITEVEHALERLDAGRYGTCEACGSAIPVERLVAFPAATLCVSCKHDQERR